MRYVPAALLALNLVSPLAAQVSEFTASPPVGVGFTDSGERTAAPVLVPVTRRREPAMKPSRGAFVASASLKPRRLAPGQSGTMHVLVTLNGDRAVRAGDHLAARLGGGHEALIFGEPTLLPPREALDEAPAYRDVIVFAIPVQVRETAQPGRHAVDGTIELDITEVSRGVTTRRSGPIKGRLAVGAPLPTPSLRRAVKADGGSGLSTSSAADPRLNDPSPSAGPGARTEDAVAVSLVPGGALSSPSSAPSSSPWLANDDERPAVPVVVDQDLDSLWFLGGGIGVFGVMLLALFWRRRSS